MLGRRAVEPRDRVVSLTRQSETAESLGQLIFERSLPGLQQAFGKGATRYEVHVAAADIMRQIMRESERDIQLAEELATKVFEVAKTKLNAELDVNEITIHLGSASYSKRFMPEIERPVFEIIADFK
ncbi:MAG: hypothetical protein ABIR46_04645 [Candidatus Saccharimonadales bacterium]